MLRPLLLLLGTCLALEQPPRFELVPGEGEMEGFVRKGTKICDFELSVHDVGLPGG